MPSRSKAQSRLMHAAAEDPDVAKRVGISQKVAREFVAADKGRKVGKLPEYVDDGTPKPTRKGKGAIPGLAAKRKRRRATRASR